MLIPARDNDVPRHLLYDAPHQSVLIRLANAPSINGGGYSRPPIYRGTACSGKSIGERETFYDTGSN
jgi:hypothetical protein